MKTIQLIYLGKYIGLMEFSVQNVIHFTLKKEDLREEFIDISAKIVGIISVISQIQYFIEVKFQ
jgi:hypothetical protein